MTEFTTLPIEDLYESTLQSDLGEAELTAKTVKLITGTLTGGATCYMGIDYDKPSKYELVKINAINGQDVTIETRGVKTKAGGTGAAQFHAAGAKVIITHSYKVFEDIATAIASKANTSSPTLTNPTLVNPVVNNYIDLPTYANAAARDVAIVTPEKGMLVILDTDGDGNRCLSTYSGSAWENITLPGRNVTIQGYLNVASGYFRVPVYADDVARDAAIPAPTNGMVIYNSTQTTLEVYDGANWNPLDTGTVTPLASQVDPGKVELATDAEVIDRTDFNGLNPLVVQPSQLEYATVISAIAEEDITANDLVGAATFVSQSDLRVSRAARTRFNATFPSQVDNVVKMIPLDSSRIFVLYQTTSGSVLSGVVVTYSESTNQITAVGSKVDFATAALNNVDACLLATDKVAVTYNYTSTNTVIRVRPATISGSTITMGTEQTAITASSAVGTSGLQIKQMATDKAVLYVFTSGTPANSRLIAFTVSGTTITPGAAVTPTSNLRTSQSNLLRLDTDKFILVFSGSSTGYANVGTIATTTITLTSEQTFTTGGATTNATDIACEVATNKIVVAYRTTGSDPANALVAISVPSTTISVGTPNTSFTSSNGNVFSQVTTDEVLMNIKNAEQVYQLTFSGTNITCTLASTYSQLTTNATDSFCAINSRIISIPTPTPASTTVRFTRSGIAYTFIGQALNTATRGNVVNVKLNRPFISNLSGLRGGEVYSLGDADPTVATPNDYNGTLTMVNPFANDSSAAFLPFNTLAIALKADTIVGI